MILYLIMGLMFAFGLFSDVDFKNEFFEECTFFQTLLVFSVTVIFFPFTIGSLLSQIAGDELREQEGEDE